MVAMKYRPEEFEWMDDRWVDGWIQMMDEKLSGIDEIYGKMKNEKKIEFRMIVLKGINNINGNYNDHNDNLIDFLS
jgi:hypothetical protein